MQKHQLYINLFTITSALAFAACADEVDGVVTPDAPEFEVGEKTPIELAIGDAEASNMPMTRASFVDGKGKITAFEKDTRLHFLMISEDITSNDRTTDKYTETYGEAVGSRTAVGDLDSDPENWTDAQKESKILFTTGKGEPRYWDDAHARNSKLAIYAFANVWAGNTAGSPWYPRLDRTSAPSGSELGNETNHFPRTGGIPWATNPNANIGVFVGGSYDATYNTTGKWIVGDFTPNDNKKYKEQTKTSILQKDDICYSNNLANYSTGDSDKEKDKRLYFNTSDKHFTGGVLEFHRAMSMFTINVYMGEGFSVDEFKFASGTNIAMKGFNKKGYLNIKAGTWSAVEVGNDASYNNVTGYSWSKIDCTNDDQSNPALYLDDNGKKYYTLLAFMIPGTDIKNSTIDDALTFTINGNLYKVSMQTLYNALTGSGHNWQDLTKEQVFDKNSQTTPEYTCLKAGINYEFSLTISKTTVSGITAQVIDWNTVTSGEITPSNARIELNLEERGTDTFETNAKISIYRAEDNPSEIKDDHESYHWATGYTATGSSNILTKNSSGKWEFPSDSPWYWPSNKTYYHFRALSPSVQTVSTDATDASNMFDYVSLTSAHNYTDVIWGAPMLDNNDSNPDAEGSFKWTYDANNNKGFDVENSSLESGNHQIYHAIGPTESTLKLILFHMMSQVKFTIITSTGTDKVELGDGSVDDYAHKTKLELVDYFNGGRLLLGNALVTTTGTTTTTELGKIWNVTSGDAKNHLTWGIVPQSLDNVKLRITTPDHNQYIVALKDIYVTSDPSTTNIANPYSKETNESKWYINRWYPGFQYNYTLKLTKKGIDKITATVVNWETVEVEEEVQIQ